jgi:acyl-CoA reductase-like NAD-dependent aldehyde dehydrogenase
MRPRLREQFYLQLHMALSETGRLVTGTGDRQIAVQPTLIRDLTNCSTLQQEELAGPWVTAASFKYQHEALKYANTSPLALAGYVLHPDLSRARRVAEKIEAARWVSWSHPSQIEHRSVWPALALMEAPGLKQSGHAGDGIEQVWRALSRSGVHLSTHSAESISANPR